MAPFLPSVNCGIDNSLDLTTMLKRNVKGKPTSTETEKVNTQKYKGGAGVTVGAIAKAGLGKCRMHAYARAHRALQRRLPPSSQTQAH